MQSRLIVAAIIRKGDKYLLGRKPDKTHPYPNTWHLLGGGVNLEEENLEEAIRREVREEAGIELGDLKAKDDIEELRWFHKSELSGIPLTRPSIKLFRELKLI